MNTIRMCKTNFFKRKIETQFRVKIGYKVQHERFGKGKIIEISGIDDNKKATIFFPKEGSKTLLLRFVKLEVLE